MPALAGGEWPGEELAQEYLADPFGEPSPGLRLLLDRMRDEAPEGRLVLLQQAPARRWLLASLTGRRGEAPEIVDPVPFDDLDDAARAIFRLRWCRLTGRDLR